MSELLSQQADAARGGPSGGGEGGEGVVSDSDEEGQEGGAAGARAGGRLAARGLGEFTRLSREQVEALRYRGEDVARSITKNVIKEARAKELRAELLNSDKLKVGRTNTAHHEAVVLGYVRPHVLIATRLPQCHFCMQTVRRARGHSYAHGLPRALGLCAWGFQKQHAHLLSFTWICVLGGL